MKEDFLRGKTALVTGASKGLGKAIAVRLAKAGAELILASRDVPLLKKAAGEIAEAGGQACFHPTDVADENSVNALAEFVRAKQGRVDIIVNNAGVNVRKPVTEFTLAEWNSVLGANLTGAFLICRACVPLMKGRGYGRILNLTSIMSHVSLPGRTAYSATKAGLLGFTKALALELAPEGITVNGISPGPIATEMNRPLLENAELNRQFTSRIPVGRWGKEEETAELALFLCSEAAGFITGTDVLMDGGWCAQ